MAESWRLFIALELPPAIRAELTRIQDHLKKHAQPKTIRWVNPDSIHLTLKFLGDVPIVKRSNLERALSAAVKGHTPFELATSELGCFPNMKRPRVTWIGLHQNLDVLSALRDSVEEHIAPLGFPTENRTFNPHLTLGRVRKEARRSDVEQIACLIASAPSRKPVRFQVTAVSLFRSELQPTGAIYTTLYHAPLAAEK